MMRIALVILLALAGASAPLDAARGEPEGQAEREGLEFFEKKIRPVLIERCYECHSVRSRKLKANLFLDSRDGILKGGDSGPAIVPGDPEASRLIRGIRYKDETFQMPPKDRLTPQQVADFEEWIRMGAPDPRKGGVSTPAASPQARGHWAFRPPDDPPVPAVKQKGRVRSAIDAFVLAKLEERGLRPAPEADRRTLLRRVTFDLTGLPPTPEEVDAFLADDSPGAYEKTVDRLLASPRYGERWARHWLDVARYSDTKGYVFQEERRYPFAYTYRDWVVRAFNEDLPYDQFVVQQIAADRLPLGDDKRPLAAMGFLTVGRRFLNNVHDIIDDRLDVLCRGFMALTVSCARCHDHKFDPIPTRDYYSLYGVFASSTEPKDLPLLTAGTKSEASAAYEKELEKARAEAAKYREARYEEKLKGFRSARSVADYLVASYEAPETADERTLAAFARDRDLSGYVIQRWKDYLAKAKPDDPVFGLWRSYASIRGKDFAGPAAKVARDKANPLVAEAFAVPPGTLREAADRYGALLAKFDGPAALPDPRQEALRLALRDPKSPPTVPLAELDKTFNRKERDEYRAKEKKVEQIKASHAGAPEHAMVLVDRPEPVTPRVFIRGNPNNIGTEVPRRFLSVLAGENAAGFKDGSGRLELARSIASPDNPLTARVMVNRVWMLHFGHGLVRTPSDFGVRSDPPSHPELLDWLARRFVAERWSVKKLHRLILTSSTYRQASEGDPAAMAVDPENRLLWKMNRRRLEFEALRDSLLAVSGRLDPAIGGRAEPMSSNPTTRQKMNAETIVNEGGGDPTQEVYSRRRSIYLFVDRQNLPGTMRSFDFAIPDTHSPQRFSTTVPQQALFLMNSAFVLDLAGHLAARPEVSSESDPEKRIQLLYRLLFGRTATRGEVAMGRRFVEEEARRGQGAPIAVQPGKAGPSLSPWARYAHVLLQANEFMFVD
jgi:hypothetical protein